MNLLFTAFRGTSSELLLQETGWQGLVLPNDKRKDAELLSREISSGKYHFIFSFGQKPNIRDKVYIERRQEMGRMPWKRNLTAGDLRVLSGRAGWK